MFAKKKKKKKKLQILTLKKDEEVKKSHIISHAQEKKKKRFPLEESGLIKQTKQEQRFQIEYDTKNEKKKEKNEKKNKIFSSCPLIKYFDEDEQMREDEREKKMNYREIETITK